MERGWRGFTIASLLWPVLFFAYRIATDDHSAIALLPYAGGALLAGAVGYAVASLLLRRS